MFVWSHNYRNKQTRRKQAMGRWQFSPFPYVVDRVRACKKYNNIGIDVNNDFLVTRLLIRQWFSLVTTSHESHWRITHSWPKWWMPSWCQKWVQQLCFFSSSPYDPPSTYTIIAGTIHRDSHSSTAQIRTATEVIIHEGYDDDIYINDIALLKVSPLTITDAVRTICIPNSDAAVGTACTISGWGNTNSDNSRKRFCTRALKLGDPLFYVGWNYSPML